MKPKKIILFVIAAAAAVFAGGCAVMNFYNKIDAATAAGDYAGADAIIESEKEQYRGNHELLYYFDKGSILQMQGDYNASTQFLEKAELKIESLYTKSVTGQIGSYFSNDMNLPYEGEDFEQVMVNVLKCLNFMYKGDMQSARIEVRKVDNVLNKLSDIYGGKNIYKQDAFALYLSGICFESLGEYDNALIAYRKSLEAYNQYYSLYGTQVPEIVKYDILRCAKAAGMEDRVVQYKKDFNMPDYQPQILPQGYGEAIIVIYSGMAPFKKSVYIQAPIRNETTGKQAVIRVAFPQFVARPSVVIGAEADINGSITKGFEAQNITAIAYKNLENKNGLIKLKAIARAAAKYWASMAISDNGRNEGVALLANIYSLASEQADTRSWRTLPGNFFLIRTVLPAGKNNMNIKLNLASGSVREVPLTVTIKNGKKTVLPLYALN